MSSSGEKEVGGEAKKQRPASPAEEEKPVSTQKQREAQVSDDEISEDSTALLPRHTKVLVTGNNRTKSKLIGLKGVVKKAVGLGGWHWLVLSDGSKVRLQRNALSVIEQPTGEESDSDDDPENETAGNSGGPITGRSRGKRKPARNDNNSNLYNNGDKDRNDANDAIQEKRIASSNAHGTHSATSLRRQVMLDRKMKASREAARNGTSLHVNFNKLESAALKRYKKHYKLEVTPNATKDQLVSAVGTHFMAQKVDERKVIHTFFESMIGKRLKTK
jgi:histone deacetylase complex subunit SAP30